MDVRFPFGFRRAPGGPYKPIRPLYRERALLFGEKPPHHGILPISGMNHNFPDVMPLPIRTPCGFLCGDSFNRSFEIGAMPGFVIEGLIDHTAQSDKFGTHVSSAADVLSRW